MPRHSAPPPHDFIALNTRRLAVVRTPAIEVKTGVGVETTFAKLCGAPWPTSDYLQLLGEVHCVVLHDVPPPHMIAREPIQRLANLVDMVYDRDVPLVLHCDGRPDELRMARFPPLDVERTVSRLHTLRSVDE